MDRRVARLRQCGEPLSSDRCGHGCCDDAPRLRCRLLVYVRGRGAELRQLLRVLQEPRLGRNCGDFAGAFLADHDRSVPSDWFWADQLLSKDGPQPWNVTDNNRSPAERVADLDGDNNPPGAVQRGVREFAVGSTARQELFNWLFSLNWVGSTPNREAVDAVGQYFARNDARGPWADFPGTTIGRVPADHLWCRRNYTLLPTDGEWTRVNPGTTPEPQPLITVGNPNPLGQGAATG